MTNVPETGEIVVGSRGPVTPNDVAYARRKISALVPLARGTVLRAQVDLVVHEDAARARPAFAKAELDVDGRHVRAHATGSTVMEAVDALQPRVRERMERLTHREESKHLRLRGGEPVWKHGGIIASRPSYFTRPSEEREVVRRKTFAVSAMTPEEASVDLEQLDHDFYLFTNVVSGRDNVIFRVPDGGYELIEPSVGASTGYMEHGAQEIRSSGIRPATMSTDEAIELLNLGDEPFVFYLDEVFGRGHVVYRRYDGHYGLIDPADDSRADGLDL